MRFEAQIAFTRPAFVFLGFWSSTPPHVKARHPKMMIDFLSLGSFRSPPMLSTRTHQPPRILNWCVGLKKKYRNVSSSRCCCCCCCCCCFERERERERDLFPLLSSTFLVEYYSYEYSNVKRGRVFFASFSLFFPFSNLNRRKSSRVHNVR